jgi:hypothetical protein
MTTDEKVQQLAEAVARLAQAVEFLAAIHVPTDPDKRRTRQLATEAVDLAGRVLRET